MQNQRLIAYTVGIIILMELIDGSALNTALPQMAFSLQVNPISLKVVITVYLLTLGLFIPASSWVAERWGIKRVLSLSIVGFVAASIACGLSTSLTMLVVSRAFQGMFGAFSMPVARLAMVRIFKGNMIRAMAIVGSVVTIGPMIGPLVGGAITTWLNWRFIFFINLPISLLALLSIRYVFPDFNENRQTVAKFDTFGFMLLGSGIAIYLFCLDTFIDHSISWVVKLMSFIIATTLLMKYFHHARLKGESAVFNLSIFKDKTFRYFTIINVLIRLSTMGIMFMFPLYLQTQHHFSALQAGLTFLAFMVPAWVMKSFIRQILSHLGYYRLYIMICSLMLVSFLFGIWVLLNFNLYLYLCMLGVLGISFSSFATITNAGSYSLAAEKFAGTASVMLSALLPLSSAFAVAWCAITLSAGIQGALLDPNALIPLDNFALVMGVCAMGVFLTFICLLRFPANCFKQVSTE
ncbi:MFS transporter [Facilibium subflavum]|uniref:MFS transporter n=1 Tax=Facilibium subflavum TaxID=2219058 RepID=UPI0013C3767E|nr:MFS transporter [Facilibium subflavum]